MAKRWERFDRNNDGYVEWVRLTDAPLLALAAVFLFVLVVPYVTNLPRVWADIFTALNVVIWAAFAADYLIRFYLALDRREYAKRNVLDLVIVVVPFLRPIRALRLLRLLRITALSGLVTRRTASLHARVSTYVLSATVLALVVASVGVYSAERNAASGNIKTFPDALWWSISTVTTVGYGDRYPTTAAGRAIAVALMVVGIALLGVITAAVAAWFVSRLQAVEDEESAVETTLDDVLAELRRLHLRLDALGAPLAGPET